MTRIEKIAKRFEEDYKEYYDLTPNDYIRDELRYKKDDTHYAFVSFAIKYLDRLVDNPEYDLDDNGNFIKRGCK